LPAGNEKNFDCYNFCGGIFVSSCTDGVCGNTNCDNETEVGSIDGIVKGCTYEHFEQGLQQQEMNQEKSGSTAKLMNGDIIGRLIGTTIWLVWSMLL
jgi:hypothetical protein